MFRFIPLFVFSLSVPVALINSAQQSAASPGILQRHYAEGTVSHYLMTTEEADGKFTIRATITVKRDTNGRFYEEIRWSDLKSSAQQTLAPESLAVRQTVSLTDPASYMKVPNLAYVQPILIGPITDTLTFYGDLLLSTKAKLEQPGQTAYFPRPSPNSWADGQRVLIGQDAVDFSLKVEAVDTAKQTETLLIQHVPPPELHVQQPVKWMLDSRSTNPNNFVQISKVSEGFTAETGKETFDVRLVVDTRDGSIVSATMQNPLVLRTRTCSDRELTQCGPESPKTIFRKISFDRVP